MNQNLVLFIIGLLISPIAANDTVTIPPDRAFMCVLMDFNIGNHPGFITCNPIRVRNIETAIRENTAAAKKSVFH
ncbi:MAG: hypothetical protein WBF33_18745 [Candidatus Nitrosopolaris sp.]